MSDNELDTLPTEVLEGLDDALAMLIRRDKNVIPSMVDVYFRQRSRLIAVLAGRGHALYECYAS